MKTPLDLHNQILPPIGMTSLLLAGLMLVAGCGSPSGPPGARPGMGPPGAPGSSGSMPMSIQKASSMPSAKLPTNESKGPEKSAGPLAGLIPGAPVGKQDGQDGDGLNPMAPLSKVETAGNQVNLASEIIFAKANPFLDRMAKPMVEVPKVDDGSAATPAQVELPPDPFESLSLLGIAYNAKLPMALVAVSGGETQTQMVRVGALLMMDGGQVKVLAIHHDSVDFQMVGKAGEKRTLSLPSVIGYSSSGSTDSNGTKNPAGGSKPANPSSNNPSTGRGPTSSTGSTGLSNLQKLANSLSAGASGAAKATPDIDLKEP